MAGHSLVGPLPSPRPARAIRLLRCLAVLTLFSAVVAAQAVTPLRGKAATKAAGHIRQYFIAAENVSWDFAPSGRDLMDNQPIPPPYLKTEYPKIRYIEYTDATFSHRKPQPEWLGILGPIIRAEVGDTVVVHFLNRSQMPLTIHPHGLHYSKDNEGAVYRGPTGRPPLPVMPGQQFTYTWVADEDSGPRAGQPSSIVWPYHSHIEEPMEVNEGLVGPIIVTSRGKAKPDGSPRDVDQEFVALFMVFDQQQGKEAGMMHAINGYIFGNLPGLVVKTGSKVRWHIFAMGNERDVHTAHWHGKTAFTPLERVDSVTVLPASTATVDMKADNPGNWMFHCHVADHMEGGMMAFFTILPPQPPQPVQFGSGDFWSDPHNVGFTVKNLGKRAIRTIHFGADAFIKTQYLTNTYVAWETDKPIAGGGSGTYRFPIVMNDPKSILGWAVYVTEIEYEDGTRWQAADPRQCVHVFWRDGHTTQPLVLPPVQVERDED